MTVSIQLTEEQTALLRAKAQAQDMSAEQYAGKSWNMTWRALSNPSAISLPKDGASQHDHYIYGLSKRDV